MDVVEDGGGGQISSMVDDLFYVVQKSLRRVIATGTDCRASLCGNVSGVNARFNLSLVLKWRGVCLCECMP